VVSGKVSISLYGLLVQAQC